MKTLLMLLSCAGSILLSTAAHAENNSVSVLAFDQKTGKIGHCSGNNAQACATEKLFHAGANTISELFACTKGHQVLTVRKSNSRPAVYFSDVQCTDDAGLETALRRARQMCATSGNTAPDDCTITTLGQN